MRKREIEFVWSWLRGALGCIDTAAQGHKGRLNTYTCESKSCRHQVVTVDSDNGVTPFVTMCPKCEAAAQSSFYRHAANAIPTHELYRPDAAEWKRLIAKLSPTVEHLAKGGLILRPLRAAGGAGKGGATD